MIPKPALASDFPVEPDENIAPQSSSHRFQLSASEFEPQEFISNKTLGDYFHNSKFENHVSKRSL